MDARRGGSLPGYDESDTKVTTGSNTPDFLVTSGTFGSGKNGIRRVQSGGLILIEGGPDTMVRRFSLVAITAILVSIAPIAILDLNVPPTTASSPPVTVTCNGGTSISTNPVSTIFGCTGSSSAAEVTSTGLVSAAKKGAATFVVHWTNGNSTRWVIREGTTTSPGTCPTFLGVSAVSGVQDTIQEIGGTSPLTAGVSGPLNECAYQFGINYVETITSFTV
jgi:hypothetical protein